MSDQLYLTWTLPRHVPCSFSASITSDVPSRVKLVKNSCLTATLRTVCMSSKVACFFHDDETCLAAGLIEPLAWHEHFFRRIGLVKPCPALDTDGLLRRLFLWHIEQYTVLYLHSANTLFLRVMICLYSMNCPCLP